MLKFLFILKVAPINSVDNKTYRIIIEHLPWCLLSAYTLPESQVKTAHLKTYLFEATSTQLQIHITQGKKKMKFFKCILKSPWKSLSKIHKQKPQQVQAVSFVLSCFFNTGKLPPCLLSFQKFVNAKSIHKSMLQCICMLQIRGPHVWGMVCL